MLRESEAYGPSSFQSTLSMRRATSRRGHGVASRIFQSTLSMRRATQAYSLLSVWDGFQSTLSMRRATDDYYDLHNLLTHFNPRSP